MPDSNSLVDFLAVQSVQLVAVFLFAIAASWLLRRCSAHLRYWIWLLVIAKCVTPPFIGLPIAIASSEAMPPKIERSAKVDALAANAPEPQNTSPQPLSANVVDVPVGQNTSQASNSKRSEAVPSRAFDSIGFLAAAWSGIAFLILTHTAWKAWLMERRLRRERVTASENLRNAVLRIASSLSIARTPNVFLTSSIQQPFVWGWFRGDIYLPESIFAACDQEQCEAIIAHELAHVSRCDAAVNLVQVIVQSAFFFHPFVWWANKRIRQEREKCCDEIVLSRQLTRPRVYCEAIVNMLAKQVSSTQKTPVLAVTGSTKGIEDRLSTILAPNRKFYRGLTPFSLVLLAIVAACILPVGTVLQTVAAQQSDEKSNVTDWLVQVQVMDIDGRPIANPKIGVQNGFNVDAIWQDGDVLGKAIVSFDTRSPEYLYLVVRAKGFAPMRAFWSNRDGKPADLLPREFMFTMVEATTVGGTVQDEQGNGIAGAIVRFSAGVLKGTDASRAQVSFSQEVYTTDQEGRWTCDLAPKSMNSCSINVYHEEYVYEPSNWGQDQAISSLLDHSHNWVLKKGFAISGRVLDDSGNAVEGAILGLGELNISSSEGPFRRTDEEGKYRFQAVSPHSDNYRDDPISFTITALKKGYQPVLQSVPGYGKRSMVGSTDDERLADFVLRPGITFTLKIVDVDGRPIEGVNVLLWNWRDTQTLAYLQKSVLPTTTDKEGIWRWDNFPVDESIKLDMFKSGFADVRKYEVEAHGDAIEKTIVLKRPQTIMGTVIDRITKQPIPEFVIERAIEGMTGYPDGLWWVDPSRSRNGKYRKTVSMSPSNGSYTYRALADGYEVSTSKSTAYKEGDTTILNFELTPK